MVRLILTEDQAKLIAGANGEVEVRTETGTLLGTLSLSDLAYVDAMKRALTPGQPRYTTQQVIDHLRSLGPE